MASSEGDASRNGGPAPHADFSRTAPVTARVPLKAATRTTGMYASRRTEAASTAAAVPASSSSPSPPPLAASVNETATGAASWAAPSGIPLERYRVKLEECAELHRQLSEQAQARETLEQRLAACRDEAAQLRQAVHRLESVVQLRNEELVLLRSDRRRHGGSGSGAPVADAAGAELRLSPTPSLAAAYGRRGHESAAPVAAATAAALASPSAAAADQAVMLEYVSASCYLGCPTHPQLIECFFAATSGQALVATEPPLTFAQSSVLHRLLAHTNRARDNTAAPVPEPFAFRTWAARHLRTLSVSFEDAYAGADVLADVVLHSLPALTHLEVRGVNSDAALTKLTDALMGATQVQALSLPELAVGDEGLQALWRLMRTRGDVVGLELATLDLSACQVKDALTLTQLYAPSAEVLLLPPTERLTDSVLADLLQRCPRLHTLDVSGCVRLTDACVPHFDSAAPQLRVLALEHCPHIHRVVLDHVEVLLSSLAHVHALSSRSLRVLPLPVQQRAVLTSMVVPQLTQLALHGLLVDGEVLRRLDGREGMPALPEAGDGRDGAVTTMVQLMGLTFSECTFADDAVLGRLLAAQSTLQQLRLYHCKGLSGACWTTALQGDGASLAAMHTLELVNLRTLSDAALVALVQACPALEHLNLHGAGWTQLTDISIRQLDRLAELRVLNLLALNPDLVTAPVVTAVARRLPQLHRLYHETAITSASCGSDASSDTAGSGNGSAEPAHAASCVPRTVVVERSDAEGRWRAALRDYPLRLLRLQHHSALTLWTDHRAGAPPSQHQQPPADAPFTPSHEGGAEGDDGRRVETGERGTPARGAALSVAYGEDPTGGSGVGGGSAASTVEPSKLFPAMAARTMAASAATAMRLPPMAGSGGTGGSRPVSSLPLPQPPLPPYRSNHHPAGAGADAGPGESGGTVIASASAGTDGRGDGASPSLASPTRTTAATFSVAHPPAPPFPGDVPSSGSSSDEDEPPAAESLGYTARRPLVQCANAAAAVGGPSYQRGVPRRSAGGVSRGSTRPSVTAAVAAAAAAAQARAAEEAPEPSVGPWEE